jgi:hypothetical protein
MNPKTIYIKEANLQETIAEVKRIFGSQQYPVISMDKNALLSKGWLKCWMREAGVKLTDNRELTGTLLFGIYGPCWLLSQVRDTLTEAWNGGNVDYSLVDYVLYYE